MRSIISKEILNQRLKFWFLKVNEYQKDFIVLNTGVRLTTRQEVLLFQQRLRKNFDMDILYHSDSDVRLKYSNLLKTIASNLGGIAVQQKYKTGEYVRKIGQPNQPSPKKGIPSNIIPWNKGKSKQNDIRLAAMSQNRKGVGNPMFGKTQSIANKLNASKRMKEAILNGSFTPNTKNSRTQWHSSVSGKKFRSSWEAAWFALNPQYEFEQIRIPYIFNGIEKIYIVDFVDKTNRILVEIKPREHYSSANFTAKRKAAEKWSIVNNYQYLIIDQHYFLKNMDIIQKSDLSNDIKLKLKAIR